MSVLTVENLGFTYPGSRKPVLKNVNATFAPGKTYAVTGPSGSGKSTLLSLLAGLEKPTEGRITVDGVTSRAILPSSVILTYCGGCDHPTDNL